MGTRGSWSEGRTFITGASTLDDVSTVGDAVARPRDDAPPPDAIAEERHGALHATFAVVGFGSAALATLPGAGTAPDERPLAALLCVTIAFAAFVAVKTLRTPWAYRHRDGVFVALACEACALAWLYCCQGAAAAAIALIMTVFFFGIIMARPAALTTYLVAAGGYAVVGALSQSASSIGLVELSLATAAFLARRLHVFRSGQIGLLVDAIRVSSQSRNLLAVALPERGALRIGAAGWFTGRQIGSYELGVIAGSGAMGEVYEARHRVTGEPAAVKLLHPSTLLCSESVCRFLREEMIMTRLHGEHLVQVYEVADETAPLPYFAMELLRGEDLSRSLERRGRLTVQETVRLAYEVGDGLDAAHGEGVVHRDLKPQNLFLDLGHDSWKILDFGVSRLLTAGATLSRGEVVGTPPYMAPEQVLAGAVDHRADLFSLGVILYRTLTGRCPFGGKSVDEIFQGIVHAAPRRPSELARIPEAFDIVLAVAMAKRPEDRFASGAQLAKVIDQAASGHVDGVLRRRAEKLLREQPYPSA